MVQMTFHYKDKDIELSRLSLEKLLEHLAFLKASVISEVKGHMVGLPLELCKHIWDMARMEVRAIELGTDAYKLACYDFDALAHALMLAVNDKDFKLKDAIEALGKDLETLGFAVAVDVLGFPKV